MFKLAPSDSFWYPVSVQTIGQDGKRSTEQFQALFKRYSRTQFEALVARLQSGEQTDLSLATDVLIGWRGVLDADGKEVEFSEQARDALLDIWPVLPAVVGAFIEAHTPEGRAKN
jgi:hypothetical protein